MQFGNLKHISQNITFYYFCRLTLRGPVKFKLQSKKYLISKQKITVVSPLELCSSSFPYLIETI